MYDRLFQTPIPGEGGGDFLEDLNPESERRISSAVVEPAFATMAADRRFQFTRTGYFWQDPEESSLEKPVFNQIVGLRNSWAQKSETKPTPVTTKPDAPTHVQKERAFSGEEQTEIQRLLTKGVSQKNAETLATHSLAATLFREGSEVEGAAPGALANWVCNESLRIAKEREGKTFLLTGSGVGEVVALIESGTLSSKLGKEVLETLAAEGGSAAQIVETKGLAQVSDPTRIGEWIQAALLANPNQLEAYRDGKTKLFGFFVGKVMAASGGKANPPLTQKLLREALDSQ